MDRRLGLVLLWVAFAVAAVGVGFAAAGLVDDPLTRSVAVQPATDATTGRDDATDRSATPSPSASATSPAPAASRPASQSVTRSLSTTGGLVSATCEQDRVRLAASPALGWEIDDLDSGFASHPRVRFERSDDGEGRVEVRAQCTESGAPSFELDDRSSDDSRFETEDDGD